jgi:uncharacterized membrane protein YfcA
MILGVPASELLLLAALIIVGGVVTGVLAGLFGIGGGALIVPVLYEVFSVLGVPISVAGTIGYILAGLPQQALMPPLSLGFVSLISFVLMAPVTSFTAPYGARLAHALSKRRLEVAFGCFLLIVCARFVVGLVG